MSATANSGLAGAGENAANIPEGSRYKLWLGMSIVAGVLLRLIAIGSKSFWIDEIASVAIARRTTPVFWHFLWHDEGNMAAYYVLLRPWLHFGYAEGTVRLLSVIPGVLSIPVMYVLGRRLFGERVGTLAAAFLALNACAIAVSQEARAYSFVVLGVLLSTYVFLRLIETPTYTVACVYAVATIATCYFHYFGVLVPAAHWVTLFALPRNRRPWRSVSLAAILIVVAVAPILWLMHAQDTGHIAWVQSPSLVELYHLGAFLAADSGKAVGAVLLALDLWLAGLFLAKLARLAKDGEDRWPYLLTISMVVTPILITLLISIVRPAFYHRFLILCLPGWILMTAAGALHIRTRAWRIAAVFGVCALSLVSTAIVYRRVTEDWKNAVQFLIAYSKPGDRVLYYQAVGEFAGESYRDWLPGGSGPRPLPVAVDPSNATWSSPIGDARVVWLVLYRTKPESAEVKQIQDELNRRGFSLKVTNSFRGVTVLAYSAVRADNRSNQ